MIAVMDGSEGMHRLPFDELEGMINKETEMYFYLSIVNPFDDNETISIFAPKHFEDHISKNRYPDCSLLTMKHLKQKRVNLMPLTIMI